MIMDVFQQNMQPMSNSFSALRATRKRVLGAGAKDAKWKERFAKDNQIVLLLAFD